ncbi:MAG: ATP-binding cassette domain-containing protein [Finegoldia sp.]|nr:ATP-binding cassette domain-containing protein [Finegoldia sp.]
MIYINNLKKEVGTRLLFQVDKLVISKDDKIGLIGDNGAGKTSFLKILSGLDDDYKGRVEVKGLISYLLNYKDEAGFCADENYKNQYSPGQYQMLSLGRLLLDKRSFLLLDEPTSHLDIRQKDKLAKSLKSRNIGYILISHDRDFINQTCDKIFELREARLEIFNGDYSFYLEERVKRKKFAQGEYKAYISEKKRLEAMASDVKEQSSKVRKTPKRMGNSEARLHKMGGQSNKKKLDKQVKAIESRIEKLDVKERPREDSKIELRIEDKDKIFSKVLVKAEKISKKFNDKVIFDNAGLEIENNKKIALLGENGSGKTSLLNMIIDREVWVHPKLKIGYYSQLEENLNIDKTIIENVMERSIYDQTKTRIILARLGFKVDDVFKLVGILSDGEKAKVKLAKILTADFNFLIMDEPTNYLDIRAIEALEDLLREYDRPVLFVSHDVSFINEIAQALLIIDGHKIKKFEGNLKDYKVKKKRERDKTGSDNFLKDFRLAAINNRLTMDISQEEREKLKAEYDKLL